MRPMWYDFPLDDIANIIET